MLLRYKLSSMILQCDITASRGITGIAQNSIFNCCYLSFFKKIEACNELNEKLTRTVIQITNHNRQILMCMYPGVSRDVIIYYCKFNGTAAWKLDYYSMFNFAKK